MAIGLLLACTVAGCGSGAEVAPPAAGPTRFSVSGELPSRAQPGESRSATATAAGRAATLTMTKLIDRNGPDDRWSYVLAVDSGPREEGTLEFDLRGTPIIPGVTLKGTTSSGSDLADFSQVTSTSAASAGPFPANLFYTSQNLWVLPKDNNTVIRIGITSYLVSSLEEVVFVELPPPLQQFTVGSAFGTLEAVRGILDLESPATGTVSLTNGALSSHINLVNNDPYGEGFLMDLRLSGPFAPGDYLTAEQYARLVDRPLSMQAL